MDKEHRALLKARQHDVLITTLHAASHIVNYDFLEARTELQETIDSIQRIIDYINEDYKEAN